MEWGKVEGETSKHKNNESSKQILWHFKLPPREWKKFSKNLHPGERKIHIHTSKWNEAHENYAPWNIKSIFIKIYVRETI